MPAGLWRPSIQRRGRAYEVKHDYCHQPRTRRTARSADRTAGRYGPLTSEKVQVDLYLPTNVFAGMASAHVGVTV